MIPFYTKNNHVKKSIHIKLTPQTYTQTLLILKNNI